MRAIRPLIAAVAVLCAALVNSGCEDITENGTADVSAKDCARGWNGGQISWRDVAISLRPWRGDGSAVGRAMRAPEVATRDLGAIAPVVWVAGGSTCAISFFDQEHHRVARFGTGVLKDRSDVDHVYFRYIAPGAEGALDGLLTQEPSPVFNACQDASGRIRVTGDVCPAVGPLFPMARVAGRGRTAYIRHRLAGKTVWWLGITFHGAMAQTFGSGVEYQATQGRHVDVTVLTGRSPLPLVPDSEGLYHHLTVRVAPHTVVRLTEPNFDPKKAHLPSPLLQEAARALRPLLR